MLRDMDSLSSDRSEASGGSALGEAEIAAYRRDGFVICRRPLFNTARLEVLRAIAAEYLADAAAGRRAADLNQPHFSDPRLFDFALDPAALDLAESLLGPDLLLWATQFFCKAPRVGASVPWHADGHYWTNFIDPVRVASVYCALDEQTLANGCLCVLEKSHDSSEHFRYDRAPEGANPFFPRGVPEAAVDPARKVDVQLRAGEFIIFDGWLLHGSGANPSAETRYSFTMRYAPTSCRTDPVSVRPFKRQVRNASGLVRRSLSGRDIYRHQVFLVRGRDRAGNRYSALPSAQEPRTG